MLTISPKWSRIRLQKRSSPAHQLGVNQLQERFFLFSTFVLTEQALPTPDGRDRTRAQPAALALDTALSQPLFSHSSSVSSKIDSLSDSLEAAGPTVEPVPAPAATPTGRRSPATPQAASANNDDSPHPNSTQGLVGDHAHTSSFPSNDAGDSVTAAEIPEQADLPGTVASGPLQSPSSHQPHVVPNSHAGPVTEHDAVTLAAAKIDKECADSTEPCDMAPDRSESPVTVTDLDVTSVVTDLEVTSVAADNIGASSEAPSNGPAAQSQPRLPDHSAPTSHPPSPQRQSRRAASPVTSTAAEPSVAAASADKELGPAGEGIIPAEVALRYAEKVATLSLQLQAREEVCLRYIRFMCQSDHLTRGALLVALCIGAGLELTWTEATAADTGARLVAGNHITTASNGISAFSCLDPSFCRPK